MIFWSDIFKKQGTPACYSIHAPCFFVNKQRCIHTSGAVANANGSQITSFGFVLRIGEINSSSRLYQIGNILSCNFPCRHIFCILELEKALFCTFQGVLPAFLRRGAVEGAVGASGLHSRAFAVLASAQLVLEDALVVFLLIFEDALCLLDVSDVFLVAFMGIFFL